MKLPSRRTLLRSAGIVFFSFVLLLFISAGLFAILVFSRPPLKAVQSTTHPLINRKACVDCHAPIAQEWRQSYHYKSVSGPYWAQVREMGYINLFDKIRKPCLNCHAPANILDLPDTQADFGLKLSNLGVECTPNILEQPKGIIPMARGDDVTLGVDCVSCHVSVRGVIGAGVRTTARHETLADRRFQNPERTSGALCITCHRSTVEIWEKTKSVVGNRTCLDCHMPLVTAPSISDGPERLRRSHRFLADKDETMLRMAVNGSLLITEDRKASFRIINDRVGHYFPSGANWLAVYVRAYDNSGQVVKEYKEAIGREETLLLDFWPFNIDTRILPGDQREFQLLLPAGRGVVEVLVRYHDWMNVNTTALTLKRAY